MEGAVDVAAEGVAVGEGVDGEEEEPGGGWESLEGADDDVAAGAESAEGGAVEVFGALEEGGGGDEVVGHGGEGGLEPFALGLAASAVVEAEGDVAEDGEFAGEGGEDAAGAGAEAAPAMGEDDAAPDGRSLGRTGDDGLDGLAGGLKGACLLLELAGGEGGLHGVRLEKGVGRRLAIPSHNEWRRCKIGGGRWGLLESTKDAKGANAPGDPVACRSPQKMPKAQTRQEAQWPVGVHKRRQRRKRARRPSGLLESEKGAKAQSN